MLISSPRRRIRRVQCDQKVLDVGVGWTAECRLSANRVRDVTAPHGTLTSQVPQQTEQRQAGADIAEIIEFYGRNCFVAMIFSIRF